MKTEVINFFKDRNGRVIGRMKSGKVAIIDFNYKGARVSENEDWQVEIISEMPNKVIVSPMKLIFSANLQKA